MLIVGEREALVDGHNAPTASLFLRLVGFRLILIGLIQPLRNKFVEFVLLFVVEHVGCLLERVDYSGPALEPQIRDALCVFAQVLEVHRLGCQRVEGVESDGPYLGCELD